SSPGPCQHGPWLASPCRLERGQSCGALDSHHSRGWLAASSYLRQMRPCVFRSRGARSGQRAARRIEVAPTLRAMPDGMPAMQIPTDGHPEPRTASAPGLLGDLEHDVVEHDDIVPADGALFDVAEDRVEIS